MIKEQRFSVLTFGEGLGVFAAPAGERLAKTSSMSLSTGGAELNVAIGLARLDIGVEWVGRIGDDGLGKRLVRDLRGEGVQVRAIVDDRAATGLLLKEFPSLGRTVVTYHRGLSPGSRLNQGDFDEVDIESMDLIHLTGITPGLSPSCERATFAVIERAGRAGVPVSFDVNHRPSLWDLPSAARCYQQIAALSSIVFAGRDEARIVAGFEGSSESVPSLAAAIARLGPTEVVIKDGGSGAAALLNGELTSAPAKRVAVRDTVGAGDAFVAGYLSELLRDSSTRERLETGVRNGAAACTVLGDWEGTATRIELSGLFAEDQTDPVAR